MSSEKEKNVTRTDLAEAVYLEVGLSLSESARLVDEVFEEISLELEQGNSVKLSSFGTFLLRDKTMRMGRNPKTGEDVPIEARRILTFHPSHILKEIVGQKKK